MTATNDMDVLGDLEKRMHELDEEDKKRRAGIALETGLNVDEIQFEDDVSYIRKLSGRPEYGYKDWENYLETHIKEVTPRFYKMVQLTREDLDVTARMAISGALFLTSAASRHEQVVTQPDFESHLNWWVFNLAPSGARKTTYEHRLLKVIALAQIQRIPGHITPEKVFSMIAKNPQSVFLRDECAGWIESFKSKRYMSETPDIFCELYSCPDELSRGTIGRDVECAENPYMRVWIGSTQSVFDVIYDKLFTQGFLMRYVYVMEFDKRKRKRLRLGEGVYRRKRFDELADYLREIGECKVNRFVTLTPGDDWNDWDDYCTRLSEKGEELTRQNTVFAYYSRMREHTLKIAGLLQLTCDSTLKTKREEFIIERPILELAVELSKLYENEFLRFVTGYRGKAESAPVQTDEQAITYLLNVLRQAPGQVLLGSQFVGRSRWEKGKFNRYSQTLTASGYVIGESVDSETYNEYKTSQGKDARGRRPYIFWLAGRYEDAEAASLAWAKIYSENGDP